MKFVKGDAIAGLIIIVVNILGGIAIGVTQKGLSTADALQLYAVLTVGDIASGLREQAEVERDPPRRSAEGTGAIQR